MNAKLVLSLAVAVASTMTAAARAQYTPGTGGVYVSPSNSNPGIYVPSTPSVPSPIVALPSPQPPTPNYPPLMPTSPTAVQIVQPQPTIVVPQLSDAQMADLTASIALY